MRRKEYNNILRISLRLSSIARFGLIPLFFYTTYMQVWLCGGSMEVLPCSRVAHIARMKKPYHSNIAFHTRRNALRVAEVWMDEYKSNVYLAWNIPMEVREGCCYGNGYCRGGVASPSYKSKRHPGGS